MRDGLSGRLGRFAEETASAPLKPGVMAAVVRSILDVIGVAIAGHAEHPVGAAHAVASNHRAVEAGATTWVWGDSLPPSSAAMVNGTMAHALDFDDTHLPSVLHPSAPVVPGVLAAAEASSASGSTTLAAVAVGLEIACRLGMAGYDPELGNSIFFEHGFHATSICGALGAAAGAAIAMGGDGDTVDHAIAIAASLGSGILEANRVGGDVKPFHCGWAAHAGVTAAQLALAGMTGPYSALEGGFGLFAAFTRGWFDEDAIIGELGDRWEVTRLFTKPYPTNHFTHSGIDAALALRHQIDPESVTAIELGVAAPTLRTIAEPAGEKARPRSGHHGRFSGPFTVATALLGESGLGVSRDDFTDDSVSDPRKLRLASLVTCVADDKASAVFPNQFPGVLRVFTADGHVLEHRVDYTRGGPERPLSPAELETKFRLNVEPVLGSDETTLLIAELERLGDARHVDTAMKATVSGSDGGKRT